MMRKCIGVAGIAAIGVGLAVISNVQAEPAQATHSQACQGEIITPASSTLVICTKPFRFDGTCGERHKDYPWEGWENVVWATSPWESSPITIRHVSVDMAIQRSADSNAPICVWEAFSGNSFNPDPMTAQRYFYTQEPVLTIHFESSRWPDNAGMQFPGVDEKNRDLATAPHIDMHLNCIPVGARYTGYETIAYTIP